FGQCTREWAPAARRRRTGCNLRPSRRLRVHWQRRALPSAEHRLGGGLLCEQLRIVRAAGGTRDGHLGVGRDEGAIELVSNLDLALAMDDDENVGWRPEADDTTAVREPSQHVDDDRAASGIELEYGLRFELHGVEVVRAGAQLQRRACGNP